MSATDRNVNNKKTQSFQELMRERYPQQPATAVNNNRASTYQNFAPDISTYNPMTFPPPRASPPPYGSGPMQPPPKTMPRFPPHSLASAKPKLATSTNLAASNASSSRSKSESSSTKSSSAVQITGLSYNTSQQNKLLANCEWKDKMMWASRMVLGGNSINGFLRATATAQRIKKQRARQSSSAKKIAMAAAAAAAAEGDEAALKQAQAKPIFDQLEEEKLKKEIMNPRTAKKIKSELEAGMKFCSSLHSVLRSVLYDVDPHQPQYYPPPLEESSRSSINSTNKAMQSSLLSTPSSSLQARQHTLLRSSPSSVPHDSNMPWATVKQSTSKSSRFQQQSKARPPPPPSANAGGSEASTLRKSRRKKLPPSGEPPVHLPEFQGGKRICTKKEHNYRLFELLRFRPLKRGDFVAARLSSRDLWILAKVVKDYSGFTISNIEFLNLSGAKRDSVFSEKVMVQDVEEQNSTSLVGRSLILPLPRTYSEASEWGQRCKKGSRVYAMYPQTTSLYPATVIDSTTFCQEDDDIFVVEFDGEEQDVTGQVPKYHIPTRFVTLIPREFPASQDPATTNKKRKSFSPNNKKNSNPLDDFLGFDFGAAGDFDSLDLDFDAPLGAHEEMADNFPAML